MTGGPEPVGGSAVVGYYVHHQGRGHLHRALALGRELCRRGTRVTFLSSLAPPPAAVDPAVSWVQLPRDDDAPTHDPSPRDLLHWAPRHHDGLRSRMAAISRWIDTARPDAVVSDVSQEVTLLCRLHGVPVISVVLPGDRGDAPHRWGLGVSDRLVGFWPPAATRMVSGLPAELADALTPVGALSRYPPGSSDVPTHAVADVDAGSRRRLLVLNGLGGGSWTDDEIDAFVHGVADWTVTVLGPRRWVDDPWALLQQADVVVTHAGQASIAEVAAARVPAIVVPACRPHDEQHHTAAQLATGPWPAVVRSRLPSSAAAADTAEAAGLDGRGWATWCDGGAAGRFADVVESVTVATAAT